MRPPIEAKKKPRKKYQAPNERLTPEQVAHEIKLIETRLSIGHKFADNGEQVYVTLLTLSEAFSRIAELEAERALLPSVMVVAGENERKACIEHLRMAACDHHIYDEAADFLESLPPSQIDPDAAIAEARKRNAQDV